MRAAVLESIPSSLVIKEIPDPKPAAGDAVVKVLAVHVLSYAKQVFSGELPYPNLLPLVPGVSCIGRIESVGAGAVSLKPGQLVFFDDTVRARDDPSTLMLQGLLAFGESQKLQSYWRNGAFSEKILCPLENVYPIPEEVLQKYSVAKLSVMNSTLVPHGGLLAAGMEPGHVVMVQPATGHFGACGVAVSIAMGASVVYAVGRNKAVLEELVKRFGPRVKAVVVSGTAEDKKIYETLQVDVTLNFYPPSAPTDGVILGLAALKPGATLMLVGGSQDSIALPYWDTMIRNITVKGSFMYPPSAVPKHIRLVQAGLLDLDAFEEKSFKLDSVLDAVEFAASKENRGWLSSTVLEP